MKYFGYILVLLCALRASAQLVLPENSTVCLFGDSLFIDGDPTSPQTGCMFPDYLASAYYLANPDATNISVYNWSRSGGNMSHQTEIAAELGVSSWGFNVYSGILGTNWGFTQTTENGGSASNGMWLAMSNIMQVPLTTTNGTANTNEGGWCGTNVVAWRAIGQPGGIFDPALFSDFGRNNAGTNASGQYGIGGVNCFNDCLFRWTNSYNANPDTIYYPGPNKAGHFTPAAELSWTFSFLKLTTTDTNIAMCNIDWNGTVVSTNHSVILSPVQSGTSLSFQYHCYRLPLGWDVPGTNLLGETITNNASGAYTSINTNDGNAFHFDLQVTNIPNGNYNVDIDGVRCATSMSSTTLAQGWNMFTNTVGPFWQSRIMVLGRCRDVEYANRTNLVTGSGGDGIGFPGLGSRISTFWPTQHGDTLIAAMAPYIAHVQTNAANSFNLIRSTAVQTTHTVVISQASGPAPFR